MIVGTPWLALCSLCCLWAATSPRHWGWRMAAVLGLSAVFLPTRASDVIAYLLIHALLLAVSFAIWRRVLNRQSAPASGFLLEQPPDQYGRTLLLLVFSCLLALAILLATGPHRLLKAADVVSVGALSVAAVAVLLAACLRLIRRVRRLEPRPQVRQPGTRRWAALLQFGVRDLLLAAACAGGLTALGSHCRAYGFQVPHFFTAAAAALVSGLALFAYWFVFATSRAWIKAIAVLVVGWAVYFASEGIESLSTRRVQHVADAFSSSSLLVLGTVLILVLGFLRGARLPALSVGGAGVTSAARFASRVGLVALVCLLLALNLRLYIFMWRPLTALKPDYPQPNAYDELVAIGEKFSGQLVRARASAVERENLLLAARAAMRHDGQVPLRYDVASYDEQRFETQRLDGLSRGFDAAAAAAAQSGQHDAAASYALDCVALSQSSAQGGTAYQRQYALLFGQAGINHLRQLRHSLDSAQCRRVLTRLAEIERQRETFEVVLERTLNWDRHVADWYQWLTNYDLLRSGPSTLLSPIRYESWWFGGFYEQRYDAMMELLQAELAIRAYRLDHGQEPASLEQLIPDYLSHVPADPFADGPIRYRRTPTSYDCYSVGHDRLDQGGQRVEEGRSYAEGDLFLDTPDFKRQKTKGLKSGQSL